MPDLTCKLLIIGAGPGGYVCAIRAGQLGIDTIIVDEGRAGGTCLNVGCIPSKALIHAADEFHRITEMKDSPLGISAAAPQIDLKQTVAWKDGIVGRLNAGVSGLMKQAGARFVSGRARFVDGKTVSVTDAAGQESEIRAEYIVIATGSAPVELPFAPFGQHVLSSTEALSLSDVPASMAVIGGGYIGLELGTAFAKLGSKVTVLEAARHIMPSYDRGLIAPVERRLQALGVRVLSETTAQGYAGGVLSTDNAIGDVTGDPMLAHRAMAQGDMVAEHIAGHAVTWDKRAIPAVCFTDPEIVTCGVLPGDMDGTMSSEFPFRANGRAMTCDAEDGFIRVVWRQSDQAVVGIQAVGAQVSELSAAFALAIEMGACLEDIAATIHAHPTLSEGLQEACLKAQDRALHMA